MSKAGDMTLDDLLLATRDHYATYHHHKEQMAYLATTLYLVVATTVAVHPAGIWEPAASKVLFVKSVLGTVIITYLFVAWQLRNREYAADLVRACGDLLSRSVASKLDKLDVTPTQYGEHELPAVLVARLTEITSNRGLLEGARFSEAITYFVIAAWTILALARVGAV